MSDQIEFRRICQKFVGAAFLALAEEHVLPTSRYHRYLAVGRDYFGPHLMELAEFKLLEKALNERYSDRFDEPLTRKHAQFAHTYIFSFLEACIARCAISGIFEETSSEVEESIAELLAALDASSQEIVCIRQVTHLTTPGEIEVQIGDIRIVPEAHDHQGPAQRICREIPAAPRAWNRELPRRFDPPHALLITRKTVEDPGDFYGACGTLSSCLERFLLVIRLLTSGTVQTVYEISGPGTLVAPMSPNIHSFGSSDLMGMAMVRRTVLLNGEEASAVDALGKMIDSAEVKRDRFVSTSFDVALNKFSASHTRENMFEQLVDLVTALEGVLIGDNEGEGLALRLCSRAAALLAQSDDSSSVIFDDVKQLYQIRSKLVHGGAISEKDLRTLFAKVSTVPKSGLEGQFGIALGHAVDQMRDLVRRAILARLCLAEGPNPKWPFEGRTPVDSMLSDDDRRSAWRSHWHNRLDALGFLDAANRSHAAVDFLSQDGRT